jgi:hypothetical protein
MLLYSFHLSHNPKVRGSNPLPATNKKGFEEDFKAFFIRETPIPKAKRIGIGKLNNPAKRSV